MYSVTCGSFASHLMGHGKGGLLRQEMKLAKEKENLEKCKRRYQEQIRQKSNNGSNFVYMDPQTEIYNFLNNEMGSHLLKYESNFVRLGRRRIYAMSQALSTAVNSLLLLLNLAVKGQIPPSEAEVWLKSG